MSGVEFEPSPPNGGKDRALLGNCLSQADHQKLQLISESFISAIESMSSLKNESLVHVIFKGIYDELDRRTLFSNPFSEDNADLGFEGPHLKVKAYSTLLVMLRTLL